MARLGDLVLEGPLGRGGMGVVWAARHERLGERVAVKCMPPEDAEAFLHEARALASLSHPHVVPVYDYGVVTEPLPGFPEGAPWLAMERLIPWEAAVPPASWDELLLLLRSVLDALGAVHARGVLHRDVKPSNLLRDGQGRWKVADFGVARTGRVGRARRVGTVGFGAPEQLAGRWWDVGPWSDLFAVGRVAEVVALGPGGWRFPVPAGFGAWLARATREAPGARFVVAADAARALDALGPAVEQVGGGDDLPDDVPTGGSTFSFDGPATDEVEVALSPTRDRPLPPCPAEWPAADGAVPKPTLLGLGLLGLRTPPFVGRPAERRRLWDALREVIGGRARHLHLVGPPGSGRWRLATECAAVAAERGVARAVVVGAGDVGDLVAELVPWPPDRARGERAVTAWLGAPPDAPEVAALLDHVYRPDAPGPAPALAARLVARLRAEEPVIVALREEVGDADALLACLTADALPVLVLTTGAPDAPDPPGAERVDLGPLSASEVSVVAAALVPLDEGVPEGAWPGDLVTGLAAAAAAGGLVGGPRGFRWTAHPGRGAPDPSELSDDERAAWALGTWLGPVVEWARWRAACARLGVVACADRVDRWLRSGVLATAPQGFLVPDVARALTDALPPDVRSRLLAIVVEERSGDLPRRAVDAAVAAGDLEGAARRWRSAIGPMSLWLLPWLETLEGAFRAGGRDRDATDVAGWRAWLLVQDARFDEGRPLAHEVLAAAEAGGWPGLRASAHHSLFHASRTEAEAEEHLVRAIDDYEAGGEDRYALSARLHLAAYLRPRWGAAWLSAPVEGLSEPLRHVLRAQCLASVDAGEDEVRAALALADGTAEAVAIHRVRALLLIGDAAGAAATARDLRARMLDPHSFHGRILRTLEAHAALLAGDRRAVTNLVATLARPDPLLAMVVAAWSGDGDAFDRAAQECGQRLVLPGGRHLPRRSVEEARLAWERHGDAARAAVCATLCAAWASPPRG